MLGWLHWASHKESHLKIGLSLVDDNECWVLLEIISQVLSEGVHEIGASHSDHNNGKPKINSNLVSNPNGPSCVVTAFPWSLSKTLLCLLSWEVKFYHIWALPYPRASRGRLNAEYHQSELSLQLFAWSHRSHGVNSCRGTIMCSSRSGLSQGLWSEIPAYTLIYYCTVHGDTFTLSFI